MKLAFYILAIIFSFGLMSGLFETFSFLGMVPNLVLLAVAFFALEDDSYDPYFAALVGGFLLDIGSAVAPGSFTVGFVVMVFLIQLVFQRIIYYQFEQRYLIILAASAFFFMSVWVWFFNGLGNYFNWAQSGMSALPIWRSFLPGVVYTLLLTYPVYWLVDWLKAFIQRRTLTNG